MGKHKLHQIIGDLLSHTIYSGQVLLDPACDSQGHNLPLFISSENKSEFEFCNVDALVIHRKEVKCIIEIEESNRKPHNIFGKFLSAVSCLNYIYHKEVFPLSKDMLFIQIMSGNSVSDPRLKQWKNVEMKIKELARSISVYRNVEYDLFIGILEDFQLPATKAQNLIDEINHCLTWCIP